MIGLVNHSSCHLVLHWSLEEHGFYRDLVRDIVLLTIWRWSMVLAERDPSAFLSL